MLSALFAMRCLVAISVSLQTLELLQLRFWASDGGVWRSADLRGDWSFLPRPLRLGLDAALSYRPFVALLATRLVVALASVAWPHPALYGFLLLSTVLIAVRWRGSFNGGSDFMTLVVLSALLVASAYRHRPDVIDGCLWYVTIIACNSYFIAGLAKVRRKSWRDGSALRGFVRQSVYQPAPSLLVRTAVAMPAGLAVLVIECGFPSVLAGPRFCLAVLATMLLFHLANAWVFGLNRFVLAWVATYPAIYHCSILVTG